MIGKLVYANMIIQGDSSVKSGSNGGDFKTSESVGGRWGPSTKKIFLKSFFGQIRFQNQKFSLIPSVDSFNKKKKLRA